MEQRSKGNGRQRVIIENVTPRIDGGTFPAKRAVGESVEVTADIFADSHDIISARLLWKMDGDSGFAEMPMRLLGNDRWSAEFPILELTAHIYTVVAWIDQYRSWLEKAEKKHAAAQDVTVELTTGAQLVAEAADRAEGVYRDFLREHVGLLETPQSQDLGLTTARSPALLTIMDRHADRALATRYAKELRVQVDPPKAGFSTWYELFPRSAGSGGRGGSGGHGTFRDVQAWLPRIARMGFDVLYFPPIHPIGETFRKGRNNNPASEPGEPGSPWAIGNKDGGHTAINPSLGSLEDFQQLRGKARELGIDIALDMAFQCSPDHPWVREHPQWFKHRPDGTIQYAENPPKKYQDIYPLDFESEDWEKLWEALRDVFLYWCRQGVRIFRVDNPHTKPLPFWQWCIGEVKANYPETLFLSEAFTRPRIMYRLAKAGFTQSYTYFTWRNTKHELTTYMEELVRNAPRDYFRPNFWPNTPDILPEYLQYGGRPASIIRLVLAATLSSNYGIYGPVFELVEVAGRPGSEEYLDSEKYEIRQWDLQRPGTLEQFITRMNAIRREHPALQSTWNVRFLPADNEFILFYAKSDEALGETLLIVVNLDPHHTQSAWLHLPLEEYSLDPGRPFLVHDLLGEDKFIWQGERNFIELDPHVQPARIFTLRARLRSETDFDYFM
ncbi:alpha-1,4-glucan--maltose-1-phosphate maltosyltransferase [Desulfocurvibacter africanus]|uniref:alpha-1,4-glucan--maltose-1-phosphate maltosyltransferase n=1 Tax=Desulfocurvibacter africanus TaxID=873 RepID=UPI00047F84AF|nr:alpha-1,4-glucan--maltose-1-phosphate maltosyltransferase [Desulfocurvibacter africanus]